MGFGVAFASGVAAGGIGAQDFEREKQLKLDQVKWGLAAKMADQHITSWQTAYQEANAEARQGNQIKGALYDTGIKPAIIDHFYNLHGTAVQSPEMIERMQRTTQEEIQGQQGAPGGGVPNRMKHTLPAPETLAGPLQQLGYKPQEVKGMIAPYQNMPTPEINQMDKSGKQYKFSYGPSDYTTKAVNEARDKVLGPLLDRIQNPNDAMHEFNQLKPANISQQEWMQAAPDFQHMDPKTFVDPAYRRGMKENAEKGEFYKAGQEALKQNDPKTAQYWFQRAGVGFQDATNAEPGKGGGVASTSEVQTTAIQKALQALQDGDYAAAQQHLLGAKVAPLGEVLQVRPGAVGGMDNPGANTVVTPSATSPTAIVTNKNPQIASGGQAGPAIGAPINMETQGPPAAMIADSKKALLANAQSLKMLDRSLNVLKSTPEASGIVGNLTDQIGGYFGQVDTALSTNVDKLLQDKGIDTAKITRAKTQLRAAAEQIGNTIINKNSGFGDHDRQSAQAAMKMGPEASIGQQVAAVSTLKQITLNNIAQHIQTAIPAGDLASNQAKNDRGALLQRYGLSKQLAAQIVAHEALEQQDNK